MGVRLIWGGPIVSSVTVNRFFRFHYLIPLLILALVILHIIFLHNTGSRNPLGVSSSNKKVIFQVYSIKKDLIIGFIIIILRLLIQLLHLIIFNLNDIFCLLTQFCVLYL